MFIKINRLLCLLETCLPSYEKRCMIATKSNKNEALLVSQSPENAIAHTDHQSKEQIHVKTRLTLY